MAKKNVKGLNMNKVMEIRNEVEEVMEMNTSIVVSEMAEHVGASLEDIDALREMMMDELNKDMELVKEKELNRMNELKLNEEMNKEWLVMLSKRDKLNVGIRNAIIKGANETDKSRFISKGSLSAIIKNYKVITGFDMNEKQIDALKKLNGNQVFYVEETIKHCLRKISEFNFNKRMKKAMA